MNDKQAREVCRQLDAAKAHIAELEAENVKLRDALDDRSDESIGRRLIALLDGCEPGIGCPASAAAALGKFLRNPK